MRFLPLEEKENDELDEVVPVTVLIKTSTKKWLMQQAYERSSPKKKIAMSTMARIFLEEIQQLNQS